MKRYPHLLILSLLLFAACSSHKAVVTTGVNTKKVYETQVDSFLDVAKQMNPAMLTDSAGVAIPSQFIATVNLNLRKPNFVILHYTAQDSLQQTINTFSLVRTQVSAHYVVGKDGKVVHMLNDYLRSWHAGVSKWGSVTDMNSCSIGIEIDNNGNEPFSEPQIKSLLLLLAQLKKNYNIPQANFIGHADIAPGRKPDPGPFFPWKRLAEKGFGYWSDDIVVPAPDNFDYVTAFKLIGYDTRNINGTIDAFKRHFIQTDLTPQMTPLDLNVLYNVYKKYSL
ncbi:N-acetylmuramoyl-L-alanine amidase [Mucilaginibacter polytrichastri]|uniref:N-acetylmuramoyl-L-alanine amidase n=1 Tax=Mucilaginibacter polytrichastri TaxID=1302689 RepID=UPI0008E9EB58|nr:N-acetylmuramoyl-L-alanine amidase [Mucilaginibacter polytrichastri]SFS95744.1 N-acetylmuramoyl-L-alanine amidase [Mucilaginibacter polytrichastri]